MVNRIDEQQQLNIALERFRPAIEAELHRSLHIVDSAQETRAFYGQMAYHLGWVDEQFQAITASSGKLIRPAFVMWSATLAHEAANSSTDLDVLHQQALPIAAAVELIHNFSLIHDDIEDRDELRRYRKTLWVIWGESMAINTGDGMFSLARLSLWESVARGLRPDCAVAIARELDRTSLTLCEGQFLDLSFESRLDISIDQYLSMIARKTAALMRASMRIGALAGAPDQTDIADNLADFGEDIGIAFQLRDDMLGIWDSTAALGKSTAGDLRRKKKSFPVMYTFDHATKKDRQILHDIYSTPGAASAEQIEQIFSILTKTQAFAACQQLLRQRCQKAQDAFDRVRKLTNGNSDTQASAALQAILDYIAILAQA